MTGSAGAITNGQSDGNRHPYVGLIGFLNPDGTNGALCTGTLVSPTIVVTAGHCTFRSPRAFVWFDSVALKGPPTSFGVPVTHPDFSPTLEVPNTGDLGVVRLLIPVFMAEYGRLPEAGLLDSLTRKQGLQDRGVTIVGYGLQSVNPPVFTGERMMGTAMIRNLVSNNVRGYGVQTSASPGGGNSGTCFGDSGGPILSGSSNVVVAVNSWGQNAQCVGNDFSYRTDTASARSFLGQFVPLP
ncbi:MAG TPA: trypsin-like serine protease [Gaiellaceae bacterium]|nr:trypsin-like serine protease [Gaiellaceae bacterium]